MLSLDHATRPFPIPRHSFDQHKRLASHAKVVSRCGCVPASELIVADHATSDLVQPLGIPSNAVDQHVERLGERRGLLVTMNRLGLALECIFLYVARAGQKDLK